LIHRRGAFLSLPIQKKQVIKLSSLNLTWLNILEKIIRSKYILQLVKEHIGFTGQINGRNVNKHHNKLRPNQALKLTDASRVR
jgi:hypothetical protein